MEIGITIITKSHYSIYAGLKNRVLQFDIQNPNKESFSFVTSRSSRKRYIPDEYLLKGVISTMSTNRVVSKLIACGTYSGEVALYDESNLVPLDKIDHKHGKGITQVLFILYLTSA